MIRIKKLEIQDAEELLKVRINAFEEEKMLYGFGPPGYDLLDNILEGVEKGTIYKILYENKMQWAAHGHTASEIIMLRADATKPNMGLTAISEKKTKKLETTVAKNYLTKEELDELNLLVSSFLDIAELHAKRKKVMYMKDWIETLDSLLKMSRSEVLEGIGKISRELANKKAELGYEKFKKLSDDDLSEIEKHFIERLEEANKKFKK